MMATIRWKWQGGRYVMAGMALAIAACVYSVQGNEFEGVVVKVVDGDTMKVRAESGECTVRVYGVDCPELRQEGGTAAAAYTYQECLGKQVRVKVRDVDRYGRTVGDIMLEDGRDLGNELVRTGNAWYAEQYDRANGVRRELQEDARKGKAGIWNLPTCVPPWQWRKNH